LLAHILPRILQFQLLLLLMRQALQQLLAARCRSPCRLHGAAAFSAAAAAAGCHGGIPGLEVVLQPRPAALQQRLLAINLRLGVPQLAVRLAIDSLLLQYNRQGIGGTFVKQAPCRERVLRQTAAVLGWARARSSAAAAA
jgi:hypothetical protein